MEFSEVLRRRRMVRDYLDEPLPPGATDQILAAARRAPSAGFSQGWGFLALEDAGDRERFWSHVPGVMPGMRCAPLIVLCCSHKAAYLERYAEPDKGWTDRDEGRWP
ncbi:MAG: nitroreductase family protein, partial [Acidimicrobiales bacterium]